MLGATFYDLETILLRKDISLVYKLNFLVGTEKYKFNLDISQYQDRITHEHIKMASDFTLNTVKSNKPLSPRLKGICGVDCQQCKEFNKSYKGAGFNCWSGRHCDIFDCCVIKKSLLNCENCKIRYNCVLMKKHKNFV